MEKEGALMLSQRKRRFDPAMKKAVGLATCVLLSMTLAGCPYVLVGGAAATGVLYYKGELRAQVEAAPDEVMAATQQAFDYFKWSTVTFKASRTDGIAEAKTAAGKNVNVAVEAQQARLSVISIRVGAFGDENLSQMLFDKIKQYLGPEVEKT
jgi:hypothetical protein